jgi:diadenosine tetraphosphate (Ap4A) HIT family hydrolase
MTSAFELHPKLAAATAQVADLPLSAALLMDDARFPWILLVPRKPDLVEIEDLSESEQHQLLREIHMASAAVRALCAPDRPCRKLHIGALGSAVRQLHVHVIARREDDPAWPGPVWSAGKGDSYGDALAEMTARAAKAISAAA